MLPVVLLSVMVGAIVTNECHTNVPAVCNVCAACCNVFIPDGPACGSCVSTVNAHLFAPPHHRAALFRQHRFCQHAQNRIQAQQGQGEEAPTVLPKL